MSYKHIFQIAALSISLLWSATVSAEGPPKFTDFPAAVGGPSNLDARPPLQLTTPTARFYRTAIRRAFSEPPNFAGHLRLVVWGCGTDCRNFALIDHKTGRAYTLPNVMEITGAMGNDDERLDFRVDSRLLVVTGSLDDRPPGKHYFLWTHGRLKRIFAAPSTGHDHDVPRRPGEN